MKATSDLSVGPLVGHGSPGTVTLPRRPRALADSQGVDLDLPWRFVPWVIVAVLLNGQRPADPVEVACLPIEGGHPQPPQTWLVQPPQPISGFVTSTHGISHKDVEDAPQFSEIAEQVRTAMAGRVVVGHHLHVDLDVLARAFGSGWRPSVSVNTMRLAIASWPGRPSYRLQVLTEHLDAQLPASARRHRAGPAAVLTTALFLELVQAIARGKGRTPSAGELVTRALPPQLASAAWSRPGGHGDATAGGP